MVAVAVCVAGVLVGGGALEGGPQPGNAAAEHVLDGRAAGADDCDGGFDSGVCGSDAVGFGLAFEGVEEPEQAGDADCDDNEAEGEEGDGDEFTLNGHLEVPDDPGGDAGWST